MADTYTYTARNADNPDKVVTFTLYGNYLRVNLTGVLEKIGKISASDEKTEQVKEQLKADVQPTAMKVVENISGPFHVSDVTSNLVISDDDVSLKVGAWQRVGGLRLAPLWINVGWVDNPEAAEAFVSELEARKAAAEHPGKFFGPLDYWAGWAIVGFLVSVLFRWPRRKS
jgi:hypothetical protein